MHSAWIWTTRPALSVIAGTLLLGGCAVATNGMEVKLYVAPDGNDGWSGKVPRPKKDDGPFATLERARNEIRAMKQNGALPDGGVVVELRPGLYERSAAFEVTSEDSGTEAAPIVYQAQKGKPVRLLGGKVVQDWQPVTDDAVLSRLDPSARGKVYQTDLKALGITEYGPASGGGLELFFSAEPMTLARWPNEGFVKIVDVLSIEPVDVRGTKGDKGGKFVYDGDRPLRWKDEKDLWLHGYWFWDWSDQRMKVESIDTGQRVISLTPPQHSYGYRKGQWYYALNALSEIDTPGEWYLERETGILYFYPPSPLDNGEAFVSVVPNLVKMDGASHVTVHGLLLEGSRDTAVVVANGTQCRVAACTIRNVGGQAINISGGKECGVVGCDIYQTDKGGISLSGGDRATLTPAGHYAENNHIHHFARWYRMYNGGIHLSGVGNRASHNLIENAPHTAIFFGGNDHLIEFNEIHSVCYESNDAGAIYAGRNWTMRGTVIRHNYLHHINGFEGRGCVGVYLDDMFCGTEIVGNLFYRVTRAAFIGGGRDNSVLNNIFVECNPPLHIDSRAMGWAKYHTEGWVKELTEKRTHLGVPLLDPPYIDRYPALIAVTTGDPYAPEGNVVARNVSWGGRWDGVQEQARPFVTFEDNLIDEDPHFVGLKRGNFQLRDDSPAYKLGFERIPIEEIGLYKDELRASWPVKHEVRESEAPPAAQAKPVRRGPPPLHKVQPARNEITVDGTIDPKEWAGARPGTALAIAEGIDGEKVEPRSLAWLAYDDAALYVAFDNQVDPSRPPTQGNTWGQDDAVEIAIKNTAASDKAPILVLRGYATGHSESSNEAGASDDAARRAALGVRYAAQVPNATHWTAEWRVPFRSLGIDPEKHTKFAFNLSVRKTSPEPQWLMWRGTGAHTWDIATAGTVDLVR